MAVITRAARLGYTIEQVQAGLSRLTDKTIGSRDMEESIVSNGSKKKRKKWLAWPTENPARQAPDREQLVHRPPPERTAASRPLRRWYASRSVAVVAAYLCRYAGMTLTEAVGYIRERRQGACPADIFIAEITPVASAGYHLAHGAAPMSGYHQLVKIGVGMLAVFRPPAPGMEPALRPARSSGWSSRATRPPFPER